MLDSRGIALDVAANQGFRRLGNPVNECRELVLGESARQRPLLLGVGMMCMLRRQEVRAIEDVARAAPPALLE
jgi:hypothetical protein